MVHRTGFGIFAATLRDSGGEDAGTCTSVAIGSSDRCKMQQEQMCATLSTGSNRSGVGNWFQLGTIAFKARTEAVDKIDDATLF